MEKNNEKDAAQNEQAEAAPKVSRRGFLKGGAAAVSMGVATTAALSPLRHIDEYPDMESFLQKHYTELTPEQMKKVLERIEAKVEKEHGVKVKVTDPKPIKGVQFVYALNLSRCIGCRKCVYACMKENNQSRNPEIQYIRVLKMKKGSIDLESSDHHFSPDEVPEKGYYYMPVQCHQCKKAPCVKVCPVKATWQDEDGIVVIDYNWCIGCRYCQAACPYFARSFNFSSPSIPKEDINPDMAYLGNVVRKKGVVEKCHFCMQRTRNGKYPACVEVCPTGSRKFGNILDKNSEVSQILKNKRVFILKEELGTLPNFFYYFSK